jgi:hypothetical protein
MAAFFAAFLNFVVKFYSALSGPLFFLPNRKLFGSRVSDSGAKKPTGQPKG